MFTPFPEVRDRVFQQDQARIEPTRLHSEASDDVWRGAEAALQHSLQDGPAQGERSARRLRDRLARHWMARHATSLEG